MRYLTSILGALLLGLFGLDNVNGNTNTCNSSNGTSLQVLGSGGPIADDGRASSGYLVWVNGRSRFLIDSGGGTFLRFGQAGAQFEDLAHIGISHFHTDHSVDLVALLKSGYFSGRSRSLSLSGPGGGSSYPALDDFLQRLLGEDVGAYAYLNGYLDGSAGLVKIETSVVDQKIKTASQVYSDPGNAMEVLAIGVPHGPVPALAYRVNVGDQSIVFSGDQNGSSVSFIEFARGTDILIMHMPVPENIGGVGRRLHAPPSVIGEIAAKTAAGKLVLSHFMARSLDDFEQNLQIIRSRYKGPIVSSSDLECIVI